MSLGELLDMDVYLFHAVTVYLNDVLFRLGFFNYFVNVDTVKFERVLIYSISCFRVLQICKYIILLFQKFLI